jgi:hypothetical protein
VQRQTSKAWLAVVGFLFLACPLLGQIKIGDDLDLNANGTISAGYFGSYGNEISSNHGLGFGGVAALAGSYYSPNFLSFNVNPYFNQSRSNSDFGSVTDASGVSLSSAIFSGSHFPGSVNYASSFNNTGNYGIPGIAGLNTNGDSQTFGVGWSALLPGLPTLTAGYEQGSQNYSIYGANQNGSSNFRSLFLNSNYSIAGFNMAAGFADGSGHSLIPGVLVDDKQQMSNADSKSFTFSLGHILPWNGSFSSSFNRTDLNSDYLGYKFDGSIDHVTASAGLHPTPKLSFSLSADYTDNLSGSLYQAIIPTSPGQASQGVSGVETSSQSSSSAASGSGGIQGTELNAGSHAWTLQLITNYAFAPNLQATGEVERREQSYAGENYGSTLYSGGISYQRQIQGGYMGANLNVFDSTIDGNSSNDGKSPNSLGYNANLNYNRRIGVWLVGGYFNYAQNMQTILVTYNSSFYNFSGSLGRRFGRLVWTAGAGAGRTGLSGVPGSDSRSESFSTSLGTGRIVFSANYNKSNGNALAGGNGLIPTPLPPIIPPGLLVFYGGQSYSFALSGSPIRHLIASLSYVNVRSDVTNQGVGSSNNMEEKDAYLSYQFRQIGLQGGYSQFTQGFSASGQPPASFSSFSIGVYRWFNFF